MRIGISTAPAAGQWSAWRDAAAQADRLGLDAFAVAPSPADDALILAASLASATTDILVVAEVAVGLHPVHLAERIAVTDQVLGGRLVFALDCTADPEGAAETVTVLRAALTARPVRHEGRRWRIPAGLHEPPAERFRVTPSPAQLAVPLWLTGDGAEAIAEVTGTTWLPRAGERPAGRRPPAYRDTARPARRAAVRLGDGSIDARATAAALVAGRDDWGLDLALVEASERDPAADISVLARAVRPRAQLTTVPDDLDRFWSDASTDG